MSYDFIIKYIYDFIYNVIKEIFVQIRNCAQHLRFFSRSNIKEKYRQIKIYVKFFGFELNVEVVNNSTQKKSKRRKLN